MTGSRPGYWLVGTVLALLALFMAALLGYGNFSTAIPADKPFVIEVRQGETLHQFANRLAAQGTLRRPRLLTALGILRGDSSHIQAGEYAFQGDVAPLELLNALVSGRARFVSFTVPEGRSMAEIADQLEAQELGKADRFLALVRDPQFIASLDLPIRPAGTHRPPISLEGFLFPDTYFFHRGVSEATLITAMVDEFKRKVAPLLKAQAAKVGLTPYQALTLASIVEKETGVGSERPLVAAVFQNRLKVNMRLASDPTVIYGVPKFDGNLTRKHINTVTPYNTYKVPGLPPTPIANPGMAAVRATLHPADVSYLFFVARGDGTHVFSKDYSTHKKYVRKYQIRPHRRGSS